MRILLQNASIDNHKGGYSLWRCRGEQRSDHTGTGKKRNISALTTTVHTTKAVSERSGLLFGTNEGDHAENNTSYNIQHAYVNEKQKKKRKAENTLCKSQLVYKKRLDDNTVGKLIG